MKNTTGIYVASRVSRAPMWRGLRDNGGVPITSTWIDEDGEGQTADFGELWTRCAREIASSTGLVFYADVNDAPWKGALVEVGIALALGKPVGVVQLGELEGRTMRPVGSWIHHPAVKVTRYIGEAIDHAQAGTQRPEVAGSKAILDPSVYDETDQHRTAAPDLRQLDSLYSNTMYKSGGGYRVYMNIEQHEFWTEVNRFFEKRQTLRSPLAHKEKP